MITQIFNFVRLQRNALRSWAVNTGCAVDYEIAENLIDTLAEKNILDKNLTHFYYENETKAHQG